jgi:hypothetical protein
MELGMMGGLFMDKQDNKLSLYYDEEGLSEISNQIQLAYHSGVIGNEIGAFEFDKFKSDQIEK